MHPKHLRPTPTGRKISRAVTIPAVLAIAVAGIASPAFAGKPSRTSGTSTLNLVLLNSSDGLAHHGQNVTFEAYSSSTSEPHVKLSCAQGGTVVYTNQSGYYPSYPWPSTNVMTLKSGAWTGGGADCTATLYWFNGSKTVTGKVLTFPVYA